MFDDDNDMWKHSEIMTNFVNNFLDKLQPAVDGEIVEASVDDTFTEEIPMAQPEEPLGLIDIKTSAQSMITGLNKIAENASKYNNEKVLFAIEQAIAEIKTISGLDQE